MMKKKIDNYHMEYMTSGMIIGAVIGSVIGLAFLTLLILTIIYCIKVIFNPQVSTNIVPQMRQSTQ